MSYTNYISIKLGQREERGEKTVSSSRLGKIMAI